MGYFPQKSPMNNGSFAEGDLQIIATPRDTFIPLNEICANKALTIHTHSPYIHANRHGNRSNQLPIVRVSHDNRAQWRQNTQEGRDDEDDGGCTHVAKTVVEVETQRCCPHLCARCDCFICVP